MFDQALNTYVDMTITFVLYNFTKISDTNQINQYLDIKNYILKTE